LANYPTYTAEDFIQDPFFQAWVLSHNPEAATFWLDFQRHHPERKSVLLAARALLLALHESQSFPTEAQGQRLWDRISTDSKQDPIMNETRVSARIAPLWKWLSAAAVVLVALGLGWLTLLKSGEQPASYTEQIAESAIPLVEKINTTDQPLNLKLSDGSRVVVYPGSRISYSSSFLGAKREVFLSGKGYFEVVRNDTKPFVVFANQLVTKVVGTSFLIDAFDSNTSPSVEVRSGKVKVFRLDKYREAEKGQPEVMVLLTANQQVSYDRISQDFAASYVPKPALLKAPEVHPDFYFENAAVADVFNTLEQSYGVTIEYDQQVLQDCNITAPLGDLPLFRKLDIICQTIGATYEVWGTRIVVKGKGCRL
jgi:transmembrane sensor